MKDNISTEKTRRTYWIPSRENWYWILVALIGIFIAYILYDTHDALDKVSDSLTSEETEILLEQIHKELNLAAIEINSIMVVAEKTEFGKKVFEIHEIYRGEDGLLHSRFIEEYPEFETVDLERYEVKIE